MLKISRSDADRIRNNISRLEELRGKVHDLAYFVVASNSGGYNVLEGMLEDGIVKGRPRVHAKLQAALTGENNQKLALDAPQRVQGLMLEAEKLIDRELHDERSELKKLLGNIKEKSTSG